MVHLTTALDASSGVPLYEQLYRSLAGEMRSGTLAAGTRMPGKRRLAAELSVSVNTVDAAYQMLAAEGYLESRERLLCTGISGPAVPACRRAGTARTAKTGTACAAGAVRPFHPRGRPGAVPIPHMGAAAKGAALFFAPAAHPRRCAGRPGPAAGAGGISL